MNVVNFPDNRRLSFHEHLLATNMRLTEKNISKSFAMATSKLTVCKSNLDVKELLEFGPVAD